MLALIYGIKYLFKRVSEETKGKGRAEFFFSPELEELREQLKYSENILLIFIFFPVG